MVMLVMFGDKDVHCPDDQVQPSWLDSTIEMRLSNLPSAAPGDKYVCWYVGLFFHWNLRLGTWCLGVCIWYF